jgi:hypothetical protein
MSIRNVNIGLKVKHRGVPLTKAIERIKNIKRNSSQALETISIRAKEHMASVIRSNRKTRPDAGNEHLSDYIEKTPISVRSYKDRILISFGKIDEMTAKFPYWKMINYGGSLVTDQRRKSNFVPGYWSGSTFIYAPYEGKGGMMLSSSSRIDGIHYIESTENFLRREMNTLMSRLSSKMRI